MADIVLQKNIGALIDPKFFSVLSWTAGGNRDSQTLTGNSVDREGFATGSMPRSMDVEVYYSAKLGSGNTLSLYLDLQHSIDNSNFSDYVTEAAAVVATGPSGGGIVSGVYRMTVQTTADNPVPGPNVGLGNAERYVRANVIPHLSAAGTDTGNIFVAGVFGGFNQLPAPAT